MKDIPIRFSDVIEDLDAVNVVYYLDKRNSICEAAVCTVNGKSATIVSPGGAAFEVEFNPEDGCWWFDESKLHIVVRNV